MSARIVHPFITVDEVTAVNACVDGKATPQQAKLAIDWIMREAARVPDLSFQLGGEDGRRASDFAEGRRYVGHLIRQMLHPKTMELARAAASRGTPASLTDQQAEAIVFGKSP
jgi:hypothetical protein